MTLAIDVSTVTSNPIVINQIRVDEPKINYERNSQGKGNLDVIKEHLDRYTGGDETESGGSDSGRG